MVNKNLSRFAIFSIYQHSTVMHTATCFTCFVAKNNAV